MIFANELLTKLSVANFRREGVGAFHDNTRWPLKSILNLTDHLSLQPIGLSCQTKQRWAALTSREMTGTPP
jgi:hypothetical protein